MSVQEYPCPCGDTFADTGMIHGQPAGLWALLAHQANDHDNERTPAVAITHDELHEELTGLADSLDTHVTAADAALALIALGQRVADEGLETPDEPLAAPRESEVRWRLACINWPHPDAPHAATYLNLAGEAVVFHPHDTFADAVTWLDEHRVHLAAWASLAAKNRGLAWRDRHGAVWTLGPDGLLSERGIRRHTRHFAELTFGPLVPFYDKDRADAD